MNYLAHLLIADDTPHSMLGNLMGDFVKGKESYRHLPLEIQKGIELHRKVDAFTDHHPVVHQSLRRISPRWGLWSGVIIDVYYDHLLALDWETYSPEPLSEFVGRVHTVLLDHLCLMPRTMQFVVKMLVEKDRLRSYAKIAGIAEVLRGLSARIRLRKPSRDVHLEDAIADLSRHHAELQRDFAQFFPELLAFTRSNPIHAAATL